MTDMTVKTRKSLLRTCAYTYAGKVFYILSVISVICHNRRLKMYEKQVHVFGETGAPI